MWTIFFFKSLLNLLQYCFCFMFWFFGTMACGILVPEPEIQPVSPAMAGGVLTTGLPGKSLCSICLNTRGMILDQVLQGPSLNQGTKGLENLFPLCFFFLFLCPSQVNSGEFCFSASVTPVLTDTIMTLTWSSWESQLLSPGVRWKFPP